MPNQIEALRNRVALYRSYLRVGGRGDLAIQYMRQIADDLDAINNAEARKSLSARTVRLESANTNAEAWT